MTVFRSVFVCHTMGRSIDIEKSVRGLREIKKITLWISLVFLSSVGIFLLVGMFNNLNAATVVWDNDSGDGLWSTDINWSTDSKPTSVDIAQFDATSVANVTIDMDINVLGINVTSNYTGIITQGAGTEIMIGTGGYTQANGTFAGGSDVITINDGNFTLNGGSFTSTSGTMTFQRNWTMTGGSFSHNNGILKVYSDTSDADDTVMTCGTATFNLVQVLKNSYNRRVTFEAGCDIPLGDAPQTGSLILNYGNITIGTGHWDASYGSRTFLYTYTGGSTTINSTTVSGLSGLKAVGGTITADSIASLSIDSQANGYGDLVISDSGSLSFASLTDLTVANGHITLTSGTLTAPMLSTVSVERNFDNSGNLFPDGVNMIFSGNHDADDTTFTCGDAAYGSFSTTRTGWNQYLTVPSGCTVDLGDNPTTGGSITAYGTVTIGTGTWTITNGGYITAYNGGIINVNSLDINNLLCIHANGGTINMNNMVDLIISTSSVSYGIYIDNNGALVMNSVTHLEVRDHHVMLLSGTFTAPNLTNFTLERNFDNSGNLFPDGVNMTFTGSHDADDTTFTCGDAIYGTFTLSKSPWNSSLTIQSGCTVDLGDSPTSGGTIFNYGIFTVGTGLWTHNSGYLRSYNGSVMTINASDINEVWGIYADGGTINMDNVANLILNTRGVCYGIYIQDFGTLSMASITDLQVIDHNLYFLSGSFSAPNLTNLSFDRSFDNSGNLFPDGINMNIIGSSDPDDTGWICGDALYGDVSVEKTHSGGWLRFDSDCNIAGDFIITRSNIVNPSNPATVQVGGDFAHNGTYPYSAANVSIELNGGADQQITKLNTIQLNSNFRVNKPSGSSIMTTDFSTSTACNVSSGTFDLNTHDLTCGGGLNVSSGATLALAGIETLPDPVLGGSATVEYVGDRDGTPDIFTIKDWTYPSLSINATDGNDDTYNPPAADLAVNNFTCASGIFNAPSGNMTVSGDWSVTGCTFNHNSGTVLMNGTNQEIAGSTTFNNFTKTVAAADTLTFPGSGLQLQEFEGTMTLQGAAGNLLSLRSSINGTQWRIDPQATRTISYLDVKDSHNINDTVIAVEGLNITNSGNNLGWDFNAGPDISNLGPAENVTGNYISDTTPIFTFTMTDSNGDDTVKFRIQIDNSADFTSPVVDYESALGAQGAHSFTVGQAEGSGTYTVGNEGQSLADDDYFVRLRGTDNGGLQGPYTVANEGGIAFRLDFDAPGVPVNIDSSSHDTATWSNNPVITTIWEAPPDNGSGIGGYSYVFDTTAGTVPDTNADIGDVTTVDSNTLSTGSSYYFHIRAVDGNGNWGDAGHLGPFYIDVSNPNPPTGLGILENYTLPWVGSATINPTWTAATDNGSGRDGYSYVVDTIPDTIPDTTADLTEGATLVEISGLVEGNSYYFHIRTVDAVGNWGNSAHLGPITLDLTDPAVPGTPGTITPEDENQPVIAWTPSTDAGSGVGSYELQLSKDQAYGSGVVSKTTSDASYEFTTELDNGTWYTRARAYDAVGNESNFSDSGTFDIVTVEIVIPEPEEPGEEPDDDTGSSDDSGQTPGIIYITTTSQPVQDQASDVVIEDLEEEDPGTIVVFRITDPSGNPLSNMRVSLKNTSNNDRTTIKSNENGYAVFENISPGSYLMSYRVDGEEMTKSFVVDPDDTKERIKTLEIDFTEGLPETGDGDENGAVEAIGKDIPVITLIGMAIAVVTGTGVLIFKSKGKKPDYQSPDFP
jgi:hypothetical protein